MLIVANGIASQDMYFTQESEKNWQFSITFCYALLLLECYFW